MGVEELLLLKEDFQKNIIKELERKVTEILNTHLNSYNTIDAINTIAIPKILYRAGIIDWKITELEKLDRIIRKSLCKKMFIIGKSDTN